MKTIKVDIDEDERYPDYQVHLVKYGEKHAIDIPVELYERHMLASKEYFSCQAELGRIHSEYWANVTAAKKSGTELTPHE